MRDVIVPGLWPSLDVAPTSAPTAPAVYRVATASTKAGFNPNCTARSLAQAQSEGRS